MADTMAATLGPPASLVLRGVMRPALSDVCVRLLGATGRKTLDPLLRNTVSPTVLRGSKKLNVIPSEASVLLDGRLLPGFTPADLIAELRDVALDDVEIELVRHDPAPTSPDMGLFGMLEGVLRHLDPRCTPMPLLLAGVTDARFFARLGIQTYGFLPMKLPPGFDFWATVHGADERIPASAIDFGSEAVYRALERYGNGDREAARA
jgi:acetylornithine deacetylase/succinyl-diaminopimelate desuccinylase-like protein